MYRKICLQGGARTGWRHSGFTLIELLVVVAIIGILSTLTLSNFQTAHVRAKVGQATADQRHLDMVIQQLRIDTDMMLVDLWDDDTPEGQGRLHGPFAGVGAPDPALPQRGRRSLESVLAPLTSPIVYMSRLPEDPFTPNPSSRAAADIFFDGDPELPGNQTYLYGDQDPDIRNHIEGVRNYDFEILFPGQTEEDIEPLRSGEFVLIGLGPSGRGIDGPSRKLLRVGAVYDPSNGVRSPGQIMRRSGG